MPKTAALMDQRNYREQSIDFNIDPAITQDPGMLYTSQAVPQMRSGYFDGLYDNFDTGASFYSSYPDDHYFNGMLLNPRQVFWIRKRKMRRETLDALMVTQKNNYVHESRHRHAMKRLRAPSGRFLTKEETLDFLSRQEPNGGKQVSHSNK